jgi:mediator of RNA polymerase II transcription subunit 5
MVAERLELFRTQTIVPLEPIDKKAQAASDEIDKLIDSTMAMGINGIPVLDLPVLNTRAGLYVYLHSLVSIFLTMQGLILTFSQLVGRPLIDDNMIFNYLNNRYQVSCVCLRGAARGLIRLRATFKIHVST